MNRVPVTTGIAVWLIPSSACASDFTPLIYIYALSTLIAIWPLLLPLFYQRRIVHRLKAWILLALVANGIRGALLLPAVWLSSMTTPGTTGSGFAAWTTAANVVALIGCLLYFPMLKRTYLMPAERSP